MRRATASRSFLGLFALLCSFVASPVAARSPEYETALSAATRDMCGRPLVLLGETGNHGSGETLAFKSALAERLVERCGFTAILFESSVYDLLELDRRRNAGEPADRRLLASAIGQLWAGDREFGPLLDLLDARSRTGRLYVGGIDDALSSAGAFYSLDAMPDELTRALPPERRSVCRDALHRRIWYDFPADRPYGAADRTALLACLGEMDALDAVDTARDARRGRMLSNLRRAIAADFSVPANVSAARGAAMFDNLTWHLARLPRGTKAIVWTATVHAARTTAMDGDRAVIDDLGSRVARRYGRRAFVLGFAAAGGSYRQGRRAPPRTIAAAPAGSQEALALGDRRDVAYVGPSALGALGPRSAAMFMPDGVSPPDGGTRSTA